MEWLLKLIRLGAISKPEACVGATAGFRKLYYLHPEDFLHEWETLRDYFGYSDADIGNRMVPSGLATGFLMVVH
jgi:hypothetical protein